MSDILVLQEARVLCQDGITRDGASLLVRDGRYVFLDSDDVALDGDRVVVELIHSIAPMSPKAFSMVVARHGPILS